MIGEFFETILSNASYHPMPAILLSLPFFAIFFLAPLTIMWFRACLNKENMRLFQVDCTDTYYAKRFWLIFAAICAMIIIMTYRTKRPFDVISMVLFTGSLVLWGINAMISFKAFGVRKAIFANILIFLLFWGDAFVANALSYMNRQKTPETDIYTTEAEAQELFERLTDTQIYNLAKRKGKKRKIIALKDGRKMVFTGRNILIADDFYAYATEPRYIQAFSILQAEADICIVKASDETPVICRKIRDVYGSWVIDVLPVFWKKTSFLEPEDDLQDEEEDETENQEN